MSLTPLHPAAWEIDRTRPTHPLSYNALIQVVHLVESLSISMSDTIRFIQYTDENSPHSLGDLQAMQKICPILREGVLERAQVDSFNIDESNFTCFKANLEFAPNVMSAYEVKAMGDMCRTLFPLFALAKNDIAKLLTLGPLITDLNDKNLTWAKVEIILRDCDRAISLLIVRWPELNLDLGEMPTNFDQDLSHFKMKILDLRAICRNLERVPAEARDRDTYPAEMRFTIGESSPFL